MGFAVDECLLQQCKKSDRFLQEDIERLIDYRGVIVEGYSIYLIGDPQMKEVASKRFASQIIMGKGKIILTGNIDKGSYSEMIYKAGAALKKSYYVHQNLDEVRELVGKNHFEKVVLAHSKERFDKKKIEKDFLTLVTGDHYML